jgi:hypothetical protein
MLMVIFDILIQKKLVIIYEDGNSWGYTITGMLELEKFKNEKCVIGFDGLEINSELFTELFGQ